MSESNCYTVLDAARVDYHITEAKKLNPEFLNLLNGKENRHLDAVAPYLFSDGREVSIKSWVIGKSWGESWGIFVYSLEDLKALCKHFRKFLMVKTEEGKDLFFRFYDPRVLPVFLPTCSPEQLREFFGPVNYFICEDAGQGDAIRFSLENDQLLTERMTRDEVLVFDPVLKKKRTSIFSIWG